MASPNSSQASQPPDSSYPSQSTALRGQRVWVSPEFGDNEEMYRWIVSCHGAELIDEPEDRETFHLLPKFSGDTFVTLAEGGFRIVAVPCLAACIKDGCRLPSIEDEEEPGRFVPIFSRALEGQFVATSLLSAAFRKNIRTMVLLSCGCYQSVLNTQTTVLITKRNSSDKYFQAARHGIPIVTPQWLREVFGFTPEEREKMKRMVEFHGGKYSTVLTKTCSHLILDPDETGSESKKVKYALQWKQKLVSQEWLRECIDRGIYCPTDDSTAHLSAHNNDALQQLQTNSNSETSNNSSPTENELARYAGSTPMPRSKDPNPYSSRLAQSIHPTISAPGHTQSHTRVTQVSVRQTHFDVRNNAYGAQETRHMEEELEALEGDSPDDVDSDSEDENNEHAVVNLSQNIRPSIPLDSATVTEDRPSHELEAVLAPPAQEDTHKLSDDGASVPIDFHNLDADTQASVQSEALNVYFTTNFDEVPAVQPTEHITPGKPTRPVSVIIPQRFEGIRIVLYGVNKEEGSGACGASDLKEFEEKGGEILDPSQADKATHIVVVISELKLLSRFEYESLRRCSEKCEVVCESWLADSILLDAAQDPTTYRLTYNPQDGLFYPPAVEYWTSSCVAPSLGPSQISNFVPHAVSTQQFQGTESDHPKSNDGKLTSDPASSVPSPMAGILVDSPQPKSLHSPLRSPLSTTTANTRIATPKSPSFSFPRPSEGIRFTTDVTKPIAATHTNSTSYPMSVSHAPANGMSPSLQPQLQPLHSRNIVPPTTVSASVLLVKSAATVNSIRKIDKSKAHEAQRKLEKVAREEASAISPSKTSSKPSDIKKPKPLLKHTEPSKGGLSDDGTRDGPRKISPKPSSAATGTSEHINGPSHGKKPLHPSHIQQKPQLPSKDQTTTTRTDENPHPHPARDPHRHPNSERDSDGGDYTAHRQKKKLVIEAMQEENDTIIASPLAVGNRMLGLTKKRKSPSSERKHLTLEVQGVKKKVSTGADFDELIPPAPLPLLPESHSNLNDHSLEDSDMRPVTDVKGGAELSGSESEDSSPPFIFPSSLSSYGDSFGMVGPKHASGSGTEPAGRGFGFAMSQMIEPSPTVVQPHQRRLPPPSISTKTVTLTQSMRPVPTADLDPYTFTPSVASSSSPADSPDLLEAVRLHDERKGVRRLENGAEPSQNQESEADEEESSVHIMLVDPATGPKSGGTSVIVTLDHTSPNMKVVFGQVAVDTYPHPIHPKLWAIAPPSAVPLSVQVSIIDHKGRLINANTDATYVYT